MNATARIDSYFSLPTDLAAEFHAWPEFVSGEGYRVELKDSSGQVSVTLVLEHEDDCKHVLIQGDQAGRLFNAVLGQVIYSLAAHSDNVSVCRWNSHEV